MCFITRLICKEKPVKIYPAIVVYAEDLKSVLPNCNLMLWDANYHVLSASDAAEALKECIFNMPSYITDVFDCENFAMLISTRMLERYHVNTCGIVVGNIPEGYHGFNIIVVENDGKLVYEIFEPQTGEFNPKGYVPDLIIIG
jgi:hypothetical protein